MARTLFDKVWDSHVIEKIKDGPDVLFIDRHFIHEVTSPVAFVGLKNRGLKVMFPDKTFATADHNTPTINQHLPIKDKLSAMQVKTLEKNCIEHGIDFWGLGHNKNGIVHVIGPENGITQPGLTIVCGDSHTSTHGAFGAIAFGIGTSEVEMVLACQSIMQQKPLKMRINIDGSLNSHVTPKDVAIYIISRLSSSGATGYFVEYSGNIFSEMSMEGRMTVCNMSIEMGARGGMIAPDKVTYEYLEGKPYAPKGNLFNIKVDEWEHLKSDSDAEFDKEYFFEAEEIYPMLTYGTNPGMGIKYSDLIPKSDNKSDIKSLEYMGFKSGESLIGKKINYVFIGSCTNSRIEDFRIVAEYIKDKKKAKNVNALIVPGSQNVLNEIRKEGLDKIFMESGFQWRDPGCSMCLAMNADRLESGERCASTSNRNFEGRQGQGGRTHLVSPAMAAAAAVHGHFVDIRNEKISG